MIKNVFLWFPGIILAVPVLPFYQVFCLSLANSTLENALGGEHVLIAVVLFFVHGKINYSVVAAASNYHTTFSKCVAHRLLQLLAVNAFPPPVSRSAVANLRLQHSVTNTTTNYYVPGKRPH
jgi:hypothetical protein